MCPRIKKTMLNANGSVMMVVVEKLFTITMTPQSWVRPKRENNGRR